MTTTMATTKPPKSILKSSSSAAPSQAAIETTFAERNLETALYHANLIQARKDIELTILLSTETLIDYPLSPHPFSASNPSPADAASFKSLLEPFQPSDYDALIEERNINEHCGYALCPNPRLKQGKGGTYRLLGMRGKAKDFRVVRKEELEMWCGDECKRRALWVRVQLSESPAWERGGHAFGGKIELLDEPKTSEDSVMEGMHRLDLGDGEDKREEKGRKDLALERGDRGRGAQSGLVDVNILERDVTRPAEPPTLGDEGLSGRFEHLALEGYTSKFDEQDREMRRKKSSDSEMDDDDSDNSDEQGLDWL